MTLNQYNELYLGQPKMACVSAVKPYYLGGRLKQYCPSCIEEGHYHRVIWDIRNLNVCLTHQCVLINKCPLCSMPVKMRGLMLGACNCGFRFSSAVTVKPTLFEMAAQQTIFNLLSLQELIETEQGERFDARTYFELLHSAIILINSLKINQSILIEMGVELDHFLLHDFGKEGELRLPMQVAFAHDIIVNPTQQKIDVLLQLMEGSRRKRRNLNASVYRFRDIIISHSRTHRMMFIKYYETDPKTFHAVVSRTKIPIEDILQIRSALTLNQASLYSGLSVYNLQKYATEGFLQHDFYYNGEKPVMLISKESLTTWMDDTGTILRTNQVAKALNLSHRSLTKMVEQQIIKPFLSEGEYYHFGSRQVERFMNELSQNALTLTASNLDEWVSIKEAITTRFWATIVTILNNIIDRTLTTGRMSDTEPLHFDNFYILKAELDTLLFSLRVAPQSQTLTLYQANVFSGLSEYILKKYAENGLIQHHYIHVRKIPVMMIDKDSLIEWMNDTGTILRTHDAAKALNISFYTFLKMVEHKFLKPLLSEGKYFHFGSRQVERFMGELSQDSVTVTASDLNKWISVKTAITSRPRKSLVKILDKIKDKSLTTGRMSDNQPLHLDNFYILKAELDTKLSSYRAAPQISK